MCRIRPYAFGRGILPYFIPWDAQDLSNHCFAARELAFYRTKLTLLKFMPVAVFRHNRLAADLAFYGTLLALLRLCTGGTFPYTGKTLPKARGGYRTRTCIPQSIACIALMDAQDLSPAGRP